MSFIRKLSKKKKIRKNIWPVVSLHLFPECFLIALANAWVVLFIDSCLEKGTWQCRKVLWVCVVYGVSVWWKEPAQKLVFIVPLPYYCDTMNLRQATITTRDKDQLCRERSYVLWDSLNRFSCKHIHKVELTMNSAGEKKMGYKPFAATACLITM